MKPESQDEVMAFDLYFASIRSMQFHPGAGTRGHEKLTVRECAHEALEMLSVRREVMNTKE